MEFFGDRRSTDEGTRFEDFHRKTGTRQVSGTNEAVVPGTDDYDVETLLSHGRFLLARVSAGRHSSGVPDTDPCHNMGTIFTRIISRNYLNLENALNGKRSIAWERSV